MFLTQSSKIAALSGKFSRKMSFFLVVIGGNCAARSTSPRCPPPPLDTPLPRFFNNFNHSSAFPGDRSQIATIILAATKDVYAVALGALVGHALCTILAVIAGRAMAAYIPVRVLTLIGALIFFAFAIVALISGYDDVEHDLRALNSTTILVTIPVS